MCACVRARGEMCCTPAWNGNRQELKPNFHAELSQRRVSTFGPLVRRQLKVWRDRTSTVYPSPPDSELLCFQPKRGVPAMPRANAREALPLSVALQLAYRFHI